jgi:hypothetical protein
MKTTVIQNAITLKLLESVVTFNLELYIGKLCLHQISNCFELIIEEKSLLGIRGFPYLAMELSKEVKRVLILLFLGN